MRVLLFPKDFPTLCRPGTGVFVLRRAQALRELGHDVGVVRVVPLAPPFGAKWQAYNGTPGIEDVDGFEVRTIRAIVPPRMIAMEYLHLQVLEALRREIARFTPDILHASFLIPNGQIAVRSGMPVIVTAHGGDAYSWPHRRPGLLRAAREGIQRAAGVTAVSRFIANCITQLSPRPVHVIWNGADERYFYPRRLEESRKNLDLPPGRLILAFAGNVLRSKGLFDLLEAMDALRDLDPIVAVAGSGPDAPELARRASRFRIDLRMLGTMSAEDVGELFGASDLITLPSHAEGLPNVVCEAMLSQRAVVASAAGGTPEILDPDRTGVLVPPKDVPALAAALRRVATDATLRERVAGNARRFANEHLTWRVSAQKYERVYREVLAGS